jgi:dihydrofolate synthase/folylpolyglutamate synthase
VTAREYLFSLEQFGIKLGLDQIRALVAALGFPERAYRSVVVAGTNGKGSVTAMVERGLRAAGYRTGRYTSPHLTGIEERVAVDGRPVDGREFDIIAERVRDAAGGLPAPPSFFEATTALALEAFRRAAVDVAVLEVGLGGRLDATNVLSPMGVAITAIDFDHEAYLGSTLEAIAREKAGVIKPDGVCVLGRNGPEARGVVEDACRAAGAAFVYAPDGVDLDAAMVNGRTRLRLRTPAHDYGEIALALRGRHQVDNAVTAVRLLETLAGPSTGLGAGPSATLGAGRATGVTAAAIRSGLTDVDWPARLELRSTSGGEVLIDGAHNPGGARALASYVREAYGRRVPIVLGAMRDKPIGEIVTALAPIASAFVCTAPRSSRAASAAEIGAIARRRAPEVPVRELDPPSAALREALSLGTPAVIAGSLYLAGEIRAELS